MRIDKVISALPDPLAPNTLYAVRAGAGFDLYMSDATGATAHPLNLGGGGGGLADAPSDGALYARKDAAWHQIPEFINVVKLTDEFRTNTTTLAPDSELFTPDLAPNSIYRFEMMLIANGPSAGDFRFKISATGLADAFFEYAGDLDNTNAIMTTFEQTWIAQTTAATISGQRMGNYIGVLKTGAETGSIRLEWAQNAANAEPSGLFSGSMILLRKLT